MEGNKQDRSPLAVVLVFLADIILKHVLGHYSRSLMFLNLCCVFTRPGVIVLSRALRIYLFSYSIPFRHVLLTPRNTFTYAQLTQEFTSHGFSLGLFSWGADDHKDMLNNDRQKTGSNSVQRSQNSSVIFWAVQYLVL